MLLRALPPPPPPPHGQSSLVARLPCACSTTHTHTYRKVSTRHCHFGYKRTPTRPTTRAIVTAPHAGAWVGDQDCERLGQFLRSASPPPRVFCALGSWPQGPLPLSCFRTTLTTPCTLGCPRCRGWGGTQRTPSTRRGCSEKAGCVRDWRNERVGMAVQGPFTALAPCEPHMFSWDLPVLRVDFAASVREVGARGHAFV